MYRLVDIGLYALKKTMQSVNIRVLLYEVFQFFREKQFANIARDVDLELKSTLVFEMTQIKDIRIRHNIHRSHTFEDLSAPENSDWLNKPCVDERFHTRHVMPI